MSDALVVNEIFLSVQGESTFAGLPCIFVRLTACNLRCSYCDTAYAFNEGRTMSLGEIEAHVLGLAKPFASPSAGTHDRSSPASTPHSALRIPHSRLPLVELTGGEPLLQPNVLPLMSSLCDQGFTVLLETSGALDIAPVDPRVRRIMDLKCPSSGECARNRWENLQHLQATDEVKFVIGSQQDYAWARQQIRDHKLASLCPVLFSWVTPLLLHQQDPSLKEVPAGQTPFTRRQLVEQTLTDALPVRFQLQMHKFIWSPDARGV
ncbi:MAG: radical SAM protein [Verrucomicrobia bacterium]|nr:radical SAM protein [Verrucomicrobiota bacterium]